MAYNLTAISGNGTNGFLNYVQAIDTVFMEGWLGTLLLISLTMIVLLSLLFSTNDFRRSFVSSAFLSCVFALMLWGMQLLSIFAVYITLVIAGFALALPKE